MVICPKAILSVARVMATNNGYLHSLVLRQVYVLMMYTSIMSCLKSNLKSYFLMMTDKSAGSGI